MPTHRVGDDCWQWGKSGKIYCGPGAKAKADAQGRAIHATGWREFRNEDESLSEKVIFDENIGYQLSEGASWQDLNDYSFKVEDYIEFPDLFQTNFTNWTKNILLESVPEITPDNRPFVYDLLMSRQFRVGEFVEDRYFSFSMPDWLVASNERLREIKDQWYQRPRITSQDEPFDVTELVNEANQIMEPYYNLFRPENLVGLSLYEIWIATLIRNSAPWYSIGSSYNQEDNLEKAIIAYDTLAEFVSNPTYRNSMQMNYSFKEFYQFVIYVLNGQNYYGYSTLRTDSEIPPSFVGLDGEIKRGLQWSFHRYQESTEITESYYGEANTCNYTFYDLTNGSVGPNRDDPDYYEDGEFVEEWYNNAWADYEWGEDYDEHPLEATVALVYDWVSRQPNVNEDNRDRKSINDAEIIGNEYILARIKDKGRVNLEVTLIPPEQAPRILNLQTSFTPNSVSISFGLPEPNETERYILLRGEDEQQLTSQLTVLHQFHVQKFSPILNYLSFSPRTLQNINF